MSPFLAFVVGAVIAFFAVRAARRSARATRLRLESHRLRVRRPTAADAPGYATMSGDGTTYTTGHADDYASATIASLEAELRAARGERAPSLYSPHDARAAKRAMMPAYGLIVRVKP